MEDPSTRLGCRSQKIKDWIDEGLNCNAFKVSSQEEALEVVRNEFKKYKLHKQDRFYEGYPPLRKRTVIEKENRDPQDDTSTDVDEGSEILDLTSQSFSSEEFENEASIAQCARELFESTRDERDVAYRGHIRRILRAAGNDRLFFLLCKIDDDASECKLDCVAAALLDVWKEEDLKCDILVTDALRYASLRQKGVKDLIQFHLQKHRGRTNATLLKIARASIPGARCYQNMTWFDFPSQTS